jgi:hypothetical protein
VKVGSELPTFTPHGHRQLPEIVLVQFVPPDDENDVLETCRELKIGRNLCVTLVIYQEAYLRLVMP